MIRFNSKQPKISVQNISSQPQPIEGVSTSTAGFLGETQTGPTVPTLVTSWVEFQKVFGGYFGTDKYLPYAVEGFLSNGGQRCFISKVTNSDYAAALGGFEGLDEVSIVYSPNAQAVTGLAQLLIDHCERLRNRFAIFDSQKGQEPSSVSKPHASSFAALYYPWIYVKEAGTGRLCLVPSGGHVAGIYARTDIEKGVHRAPANELVKGAVGLEFAVNQRQQDILNPQGINCIRDFAGRGILVWGARTRSSDPEKKYVNVQRLLIYLEQSITKGTAWTTFELNNEVTWNKVKASVLNFLMNTWHIGMLMGATPQEAYFVKCDKSTMTQNNIDAGRLIIQIGIAPIKPSEYIILRVSQNTIHS